MKKLIAIVALVATTFVSANAQLLYRITSDSQQKPSYIIGTFHLEDGSYLDKIPGANAALDEVDQVYGEIDIKSMTNPDTIAATQAMIMLSGDKTIKDVLTAEQYEKLDKYVESIVGTGLSNPALFQQMGKMNPATLEINLSIMSFLKKMPGKFNPNNLLDLSIQQTAIQKGKKTNGLETMDFQTRLLYARPMNEMVDQLMCTIDNNDFYDKQNLQLLDAYHEHDVEKLLEITYQTMGNKCDFTEDYINNLIFNRNSDWARKIPSIIKDTPTLFVVGAGHLGGEKGVVNLLRKTGFKVEGVK